MTNQINKRHMPHTVQHALHALVMKINEPQMSPEELAESMAADDREIKQPVLTQLKNLDELLGGMNPGELVIVSGVDHGMCSDLIHYVAANVSLKSKLPIALVAPNIPVDESLLSIFCSLEQINKHRMLTGELSDSDWPKLTSAMSRLQESSLYMYGDEYSNLSEICSHLSGLHQYCGLGAIFVDSIDSFEADGDIQQAQVTSTIQALKPLANELCVPIIVSMGTDELRELPGDSKPTLSDLNLTEENLKLADRVFVLQGNKMSADDDAQLVSASLVQNAFGANGVASLHYHEDWRLFTS
ncbi:DnaB-like helicase C-terminal domain-containing protein [Pseudomonadota bacterium]